MSSDASARAGSQSFRLGAGLLLGLLLGHRSLMAAALGTEQFELAIAHFVLVVLASLVGLVAVASTFERLVTTEHEGDPDDDGSGESVESGDALVARDNFSVPELSQSPAEFTPEP